MKAYRLIAHGENFSVAIDGDRRNMGFYLPVFVLAEDAAIAMELAREALVERLDAKSAVSTKASTVVFENVVEIDSREVPTTLPGFAWFAS